MNVFSIGFLVVGGILLVSLPRRSAAIPLLLAAAYTTRDPLLELGPANLSVLRILVLIGIVRVLGRGERVANGINAVDWLAIAWATLLVAISVFHTSDAWTFRLGMVLGELGTYGLCRVFIQDAEDVIRVFKFLCVALAPLAVLMVMEKYTAHNYFGGGLNFRDGHVRAYGAFAHPILAGGVGATCVPMALSLWRTNRARAVIGLGAAFGIVFATTASGPVMMTFFIGIGLLIWKVRDHLALIRWGTVAAIIALDIVMKDPVYFLMARIDFTGSSTGWYRAQLVRQTIEHVGEWWAVGTDYTFHWMPTGTHAGEVHTDIVNHFVAMCVAGGLPLLVLFLLMLRAAFRAVGKALRENTDRSPERAFLIWTLGVMLFGQVMNFWSTSLYDQSAAFFYLVLATIGAVQAPAAALVRHRLPSAASSPKRNRQTARASAAAGKTGGAAALPDRPVQIAKSWRRRSPYTDLAGTGR